MRLVLHYILISSGVLFIVTGIAGLFLPLVPGLVLIGLGFWVMGKKKTVIDWINKLPPPLNKTIYFKK